MDQRLPRSWAAAVAALVFVAYVAMTPPVPGDGDSGEFTIVLARAALAHPTGYPIYTMLGHAFCVAMHAAGAPWELAAGLWSALGGAVAAYFAFRLADRLVSLLGERAAMLGRPARFALAAAATILFALNPMVSFEATHAEVYTWHLAWACGTALLFVHVITNVFGGEDPGKRRVAWSSAWWGLACGIGVSHHSTAVLVAGPATLALLWRLGSKWPRRLASCAIGIATALVGLSSYGFVFWRISHPDAADWIMFDHTFQGAIDHIRAKQYDWVVGEFAPSAIQQEWLGRWIYPFVLPGLAMLGVAAVLAAPDRGRRLALWTLFAAAAANVVFAFGLSVYDPSSYFLTPLALGVVGLAPVAARIAVSTRRLAKLLPVALLIVVLTTGASWILTGLDRKATVIAADALIRDMWKSVPDAPGFLFWDNDMFHRLRMYQYLRGEKQDVEVRDTNEFQSPVIQAAFVRRHGFNPFDGFGDIVHGPVALQQQREGLHDNINRKSPLPVYEFLPEIQKVRLLRKPPRTESR